MLWISCGQRWGHEGRPDYRLAADDASALTGARSTKDLCLTGAASQCAVEKIGRDFHRLKA